VGGSDAPVQEMKTLKPGWRDESQAKELLERAVRTCFPLMRRRGWRVPLVDEFFPKNPSLLGLNINGGQKIRLRLRKPGAGGGGSGFSVVAPRERQHELTQQKPVHEDGGFFSFDHVLGTMLHELCHNEHGPHNAQFYALLDEIREEVEKDIASGAADNATVTTAFGGQGRRLGSSSGGSAVGWDDPGRNPIVPATDRREKAAQAAQKRLGRAAVGLGGGPRRLGGAGAGSWNHLSPREAAARAAERRALDEQTCAKAGEVIDLVGEDSDDESIGPAAAKNPEPALQMQQQQQQQQQQEQQQQQAPQSKSLPTILDLTGDPATSSKRRPAAQAAARSALKRTKTESDSTGAGEWPCSACTFLNPVSTRSCAVCDNPRVAVVAPWACGHCTLRNAPDRKICSACGLPQVSA
jgi:DNA-dependent metalloprotease WSS1